MHSLLEERLQALGWQRTAQQLDELVESASANTLSYFDFLDTLVKQEWEQRESEELAKRIRKAKFPYKKTIYEFDFSFQPSISEQRLVPAALSLMERIASSSANSGWARHI